MPKTILLTGVTGYIAKHIALQLLEAGYHVRGTLRDPARSTEVIAALRPLLTDSGDLENRLTFVTLDLTADAGWDDAMAGVDVLMHTASPFPMRQPKDENDLIRPAVDGTLRALRAAQAAGVYRVVLTSSTAAISGSALPAGDVSYSETNWTNPDDPAISAYTKSKTLAELAAWNFRRDAAPAMQLTVINPGFVLGAPLDAHFGTSLAVVKRLLRGKDPMLPNVGFACVDVQDVAELHVGVIERPDTFGQRIMAVDRFMSFKDIALVIKAAFPQSRVSTRVAPDLIVRFLALFDPSIREITPFLGRIDKIDNARAISTLGRGMRRTQKAITSAAAYLVENKLV